MIHPNEQHHPFPKASVIPPPTYNDWAPSRPFLPFPPTPLLAVAVATTVVVVVAAAPNLMPISNWRVRSDSDLNHEKVARLLDACTRVVRSLLVIYAPHRMDDRPSPVYCTPYVFLLPWPMQADGGLMIFSVAFCVWNSDSIGVEKRFSNIICWQVFLPFFQASFWNSYAFFFLLKCLQKTSSVTNVFCSNLKKFLVQLPLIYKRWREKAFSFDSLKIPRRKQKIDLNVCQQNIKN